MEATTALFWLTILSWVCMMLSVFWSNRKYHQLKRGAWLTRSEMIGWEDYNSRGKSGIKYPSHNEPVLIWSKDGTKLTREEQRVGAPNNGFRVACYNEQKHQWESANGAIKTKHVKVWKEFNSQHTPWPTDDKR